jgi:hypothetical protein
MKKHDAEGLLGCLAVPALLGFIFWIASPSDEWKAHRAEQRAAQAQAEQLGTTLPPTDGELFTVPSDTAAVHRLLEWRQMSNGHREALTRRDGANSGTTFARVEIDCDRLEYRPLGQGDTVEEARQTYSDLGDMAKIVPDSIQYWKRIQVCALPLHR